MHNDINTIDDKKYQLVFKEVFDKYKEGKDIMLQDMLKFYDAKMNIFLKRCEDSGKRDMRALMKSVNAMLFYDVLDINNPMRYI